MMTQLLTISYAWSYQEQRPEDIHAHLLLGDLLRDSGELDAAEEHYKQAQILENSPVRQTWAQEEFLSQSVGLLDLTLNGLG